MRRMPFALLLVALVVVGWPSSRAVAQTTKTARGTVTAVGPDSITVKVADHDMQFAVDPKTAIMAPGAGTKTRRATAAGASGAKITELLKAGDNVEVRYTDSGGTMRAASIRSVASAGTAGSSAAAAETTRGTVKSVSADSLTITGSGGGGATFTQVFTIDANSRVVGQGAGTAAAAGGGRTVITDVVHVGDTVSVAFHKMGDSLHASEVRVTVKAR
jgi:hypothetical protein